MYAWLYLVISVLMRSSPPETEVQTWDMQRHCTAPWQPLLQVTFHLLWMSKIIRLGLALWCCESSWNLKHFKAMAVPASASLAVLNMRKKVPVEWNHSCCSTRDTIILINNEDELLSILGKICMSKGKSNFSCCSSGTSSLAPASYWSEKLSLGYLYAVGQEMIN